MTYNYKLYKLDYGRATVIRRHARTRVESVLIRAKSTCVLVTGTRGGSTDKGRVGVVGKRGRGAGRSILALLGLRDAFHFFFFSNSHAHHVRIMCRPHTRVREHTQTAEPSSFFLFLFNRSRFVVSHAVVMKTMAYNMLYAIQNCAQLFCATISKHAKGKRFKKKH